MSRAKESYMMIRAAIATAVCLGVVVHGDGSGAGAAERRRRRHRSRPPRQPPDPREMATALGRLVCRTTYGCATGHSWGAIAATMPPSSLPPAGRRTRRVHGRFHHRPVAAAAVSAGSSPASRTSIVGSARRRRRKCSIRFRPDVIDLKPEGRRHSGWHKRHCGQHRPDDE